MDLASVYLNKEVIKFCKLQYELVEWRNKCLQYKSFCTPPNTNAIDIDILYAELTHRKRLFIESCPNY